MIIQTTRFFGAALSLWLAGTTLSQAGALYKWVGEDGSVHYSAQSPVLSKSQSMQRMHIHTQGSKEILAPDFDSNRNIVAEQANAMAAQESERTSAAHPASDPTLLQRKSTHTAEAASTPNIQVRASRTTDRGTSAPQHDGSPKTVVDVLTDPVQVQ